MNNGGWKESVILQSQISLKFLKDLTGFSKMILLYQFFLDFKKKIFLRNYEYVACNNIEINPD